MLPLNAYHSVHEANQSACLLVPAMHAAQLCHVTILASCCCCFCCCCCHLQAVREAKKAAKRERREAERRAAVEELAAAAPLSPRNTAQRARERLRSDGSRGGSRGDWLMGSEDFEEAAGGGREASPAVPRGSVGSQGLDDGALLVDTLSSR
jgi:hypothetical protein